MRERTQFFVHGGSCSLLFDNWTGSGSLVDAYGLHEMDALRVVRISDVWLEDKWNFPVLSELLSPEVVEFLTQFNFTLTNLPDEAVWTPTSAGTFTVASAFEECRPRQQQWPVLRYVWSLVIPLRYSLFCWRLLNSLFAFPKTFSMAGVFNCVTVFFI